MRRQDFIPDVIWIRRDGELYLTPLRRADDPESWLAIVNSGDAVATQVDDGQDRYDGKGVFPTSSSSAQWLMDKMLDLLEVQAGMNVLEIGTGTGYNAALLAELAGPEHVVTIEVDPTIADHARHTLTKAGYPVTVITADGALGHPGRAPYDRLIATAATSSVPYPWVEQTRPAGRIVVPLLGTFQYGALACLTVHGDGTADGRFHGEASFMPLRDRRPQPVPWILTEEHARMSNTTLYPHEPFNEFDAAIAIGAVLPGCTTGRTQRGKTESLRLFHADTQSWAALAPATHDSGHYTIQQYGPRNLWGELETAYRWWIDAKRPDHTRIGITVTPEGQTFWLDTPAHPLPVGPPAT